MDYLIRRAQPADFAGLAQLLADPRVFPGTLQLPFASAEAWRKRMAEFPETDLAFVAEADGRIVGNAALHAAGKTQRRAHAMSIAVIVAGDWQGRGLGTALMKTLLDVADNWLNVFRLELTVFADNERAIALYRRFGFEVEGTHRAYALRDGRYADTHSMARLKLKTPAV
jgi:putative acetyltransferase